MVEFTRICTYNEQEYFFHGFFQASNLYDASPMIGGHPGGAVFYPVAVIEDCQNGQVHSVPADAIRFTGETNEWCMSRGTPLCGPIEY